MAFFGILTVVAVLHIALFISVNLKDSPREQTPQSLIKVSFITKSAPIKAKQNDTVVAQNQSIKITPESPPHPKIAIKQIENKPLTKTVEPKKEQLKPKVIVVQKSKSTVENVIKSTKPIKIETLKNTAELPKEKPHLSLESLQQQISQIGTEVRQQQVSERDKYINQFSSKVKRIGQTIYDRGTLPAGILETKIEINADGSLVDFKITRSSGNTKLDDAVENMIRSSAPYQNLPFQLLSESNTLIFKRVWEFYGD